MPNYKYKCKECDYTFSIKATVKEKSEGLDPGCPECKSKNVFQSFSGIGIVSSGNSRGGGCIPGGGCC